MKLGAATLGVLLLGGCLLPQEDQFLDDLGPMANNPPRILEDQVSANSQPGHRVLLDYGTGCKLKLEARVQDPDERDAIRYRLYIDYDPNPTAPPFKHQPWEAGTLTSSNVAGSTLSVPLFGGEGLPSNATGNPLASDGEHVIELVVTDGNLEPFAPPGTQPEPDAVSGFDGGNPRYAVTYAWLVTVDTTKDCGAP